MVALEPVYGYLHFKVLVTPQIPYHTGEMGKFVIVNEKFTFMS